MNKYEFKKISDLKRIVDRNQADREKDAARMRDYNDRIRAILSAPQISRQDFFCRPCRLDFSAIAYQHIARIYNLNTHTSSWPRIPTAVYEAKCPKKHPCERRITDKQRDPYYYYSLKMARERDIYRDDMLQPSDPRFRSKYPKMWEHLEAKKEAYEKTLE